MKKAHVKRHLTRKVNYEILHSRISVTAQILTLTEKVNLVLKIHGKRLNNLEEKTK